MVSSVLNMTGPELAEMLQRRSPELKEDPEFQRLRGRLPEDWPI